LLEEEEAEEAEEVEEKAVGRCPAASAAPDGKT